MAVLMQEGVLCLQGAGGLRCGLLWILLLQDHQAVCYSRLQCALVWMHLLPRQDGEQRRRRNYCVLHKAEHRPRSMF
jgi:hypothetical protein